MAEQQEHSNVNLTILQRIAENDINAANELLASYGNFVYSLAKKFTYTHEDAEDATQEIFPNSGNTPDATIRRNLPRFHSLR